MKVHSAAHMLGTLLVVARFIAISLQADDDSYSASYSIHVGGQYDGSGDLRLLILNDTNYADVDYEQPDNAGDVSTSVRGDRPDEFVDPFAEQKGSVEDASTSPVVIDDGTMGSHIPVKGVVVIVASVSGGVIFLCLVCLLFYCVCASKEKKRLTTETYNTHCQGAEGSINKQSYQYNVTEVTEENEMDNIITKANNEDENVDNPSYQNFNSQSEDVREEQAEMRPSEDRRSFVNDTHDGTDRNIEYDESRDGIDVDDVEEEGSNSDQKPKVTAEVPYVTPDGELIKAGDFGGQTPAATSNGHTYAEVHNDKTTGSKFAENDVTIVDKNDDGIFHNIVYESSGHLGARAEDDVTYDIPEGELISKESTSGRNDGDTVYNVAYESSGEPGVIVKNDGDSTTYYDVVNRNDKPKCEYPTEVNEYV